jgi:transmembrane sensor
MDRKAGSRREAVRLEAAGWVVRLDDRSCSDVERAAAEAWRAESPEHEAAFEREAAAWSRMNRLQALRPQATEPVSDLLGASDRSPASYRSNWARAAAVVGILGVIAAGAVSTTASTAYATAVGERRVIVLKDNSRIELNTDSKILVRFSLGAREIRIVRGEALVTAAGSDRPLVLRIGDARLQAASEAEIILRVDDDSAAFTVRDGSVEVDDQSSRTETRLSAGGMAVYGPLGETVRRVSAAEIDRTLAWRTGAIAFNGQTLDEAVAELNRYNRTQIIVGDPEAASLRLAGYFQSTEPESFVAAVTSTFAVRATRDSSGVVRLTAVATPAANSAD